MLRCNSDRGQKSHRAEEKMRHGVFCGRSAPLRSLQSAGLGTLIPKSHPQFPVSHRATGPGGSMHGLRESWEWHSQHRTVGSGMAAGEGGGQPRGLSPRRRTSGGGAGRGCSRRCACCSRAASATAGRSATRRTSNCRTWRRSGRPCRPGPSAPGIAPDPKMRYPTFSATDPNSEPGFFLFCFFILIN